MGYTTCGTHGGTRDGRHCCDVCDACTLCEGLQGVKLYCQPCCGPLFACSEPCATILRAHIAEANGTARHEASLFDRVRAAQRVRA